MPFEGDVCGSIEMGESMRKQTGSGEPRMATQAVIYYMVSLIKLKHLHFRLNFISEHTRTF